MGPTPLPSEVVQFLRDRIDTVPELEALLLAHAHPEMTWRSDSLSSRLYVSTRETGAILSKLARLGLLMRVDGDVFQYDPSTADAPVVQLLAECYQKQLSLIARAIHEKPSLGLREFAQAFSVKKREE